MRRQIEKFRTQSQAVKRRYTSGEQIFLWGATYGLVVIESLKPAYKIMGDKLLLYLPKKSSVDWREKFMREVYRAELIYENPLGDL